MWKPPHIRTNVNIKKFNFLISSDLNVYQMKRASPSDVVQFYKKYQDTTYALWSSVVTVVQRTPDLCFFGVRVRGLPTAVL
jgi:hypothetical protein